MRHEPILGRPGRRASAGILMLFCALCSLPAAAIADEWLDRAQQDLGLVTGNESAEQELFPALVAMDEFPIGSGSEIYANPADYLYIPRGDARRQQMIDWVGAPAQQAALEAVRTVTDPDNNFMFSLQIGRDKVPSEWAEAGLFIEAGHNDLLSLTRFVYIDPMNERLVALAYANGIAMAEAGDGDEALVDHSRFLTLFRLLLERPTTQEKQAALDLIALSCDLMTDLAYQYTRPGDGSFTAMGISDAILETDDALQRFRFRDFNLPIMVQYEARQAFDRASGGEREVDPNAFSAMLALKQDNIGLSKFGSYAAYQPLGSLQADRNDFDRKFNDLFTDFERRWNYSSLHDPMLDVSSVADELDPSRYYILVEFGATELAQMFSDRLEILTHLSGTRCALGVVAFHMQNGNLPGRLVSIQPNFVRSLNDNLDFVSYNDRIEASEPLKYWVPIRDERFREDESPSPYPIRVVFADGGLGYASGNAQPATRQMDLFEAIPFPGFGVDADDLAAGSDGDFNTGDFGSMVGFGATGFSEAEAQRFTQELLVSGTVPRFGLSEEDHAAFEAYLTGESDSFDFSALRSVIKSATAEQAPSEMDAQQLSVGLAALQVQGITPDGAGAAVRAQLEQLVEMGNSGLGGMDPGEMPDMNNPAAMFLAGGDINEAVTAFTGRSVSQLIDYIVSVVERLAAVPSLREAIEEANRGEFMTASELVALTNDVTDALVVPQVINPLRDMLVHFRSSEIGQMMASMPMSDQQTTQVVFAIDDSSFLLYSVGENGRDDRAALCDDGSKGDRLYWPPSISLYREYRNR